MPLKEFIFAPPVTGCVLDAEKLDAQAAMFRLSRQQRTSNPHLHRNGKGGARQPIPFPVHPKRNNPVQLQEALNQLSQLTGRHTSPSRSQDVPTLSTLSSSSGTVPPVASSGGAKPNEQMAARPQSAPLRKSGPLRTTTFSMALKKEAVKGPFDPRQDMLQSAFAKVHDLPDSTRLWESSDALLSRNSRRPQSAAVRRTDRDSLTLPKPVIAAPPDEEKVNPASALTSTGAADTSGNTATVSISPPAPPPARPVRPTSAPSNRSVSTKLANEWVDATSFPNSHLGSGGAPLPRAVSPHRGGGRASSPAGLNREQNALNTLSILRKSVERGEIRAGGGFFMTSATTKTRSRIPKI
jgi:hypothetical protein